MFLRKYQEWMGLDWARISAWAASCGQCFWPMAVLSQAMNSPKASENVQIWVTVNALGSEKCQQNKVKSDNS